MSGPLLDDGEQGSAATREATATARANVVDALRHWLREPPVSEAGRFRQGAGGPPGRRAPRAHVLMLPILFCLRMMDALERDRVSVNRFNGEGFCARFGVNIDSATNPSGYRALFDIRYLIDGARSISEIAE